MTRHRWAATALCLVAVVAAQAQWPAPPVPSPVGFQSINNDRFSQLRRQAMQFVGLGHDRASSSSSGIEMPSSRLIAEAYQSCGWRGARNICCCGSHWTRSSGRPPFCRCGQSSNGSWSHWIIWNRCWLVCRSLFLWIGCCRFSPARSLMGRDVARGSRAWLDSTEARAAAAQVRGWSPRARPRKCPGGCAC